MFFAEAQIRVQLYGQPCDMRKSYDGLQALGKRQIRGVLFLFPLMGDRLAERLQRGGVMGTDRRIHRDEATWREIFARQEASGVLRSQFCREEGINPGVFRRWREKLHGEARGPKRRLRPGSKVAAPFIEMGALETGRSRWEVRLELAPGVVLSIARG